MTRTARSTPRSHESASASPIGRRRWLAAAGSLAACSALAASRADRSAAAARQETEPERGRIGRTPHTKFAVNIEMWWTRLPFLDRIRRAAEFGFPAVEFWPYQGKDLAAIAALTQELGVEVAQFTAWGFSPGMNHPDQEDPFAAQIEEACAAAHQLRCRQMTVVAGNLQPDRTAEQMIDQVVRALQRVAPLLEREQVMAILEPMNPRDHPGHLLYGSRDAIDIVRRVGSPMVKINWDLYHMQKVEGDLCVHLREGFEHVGYLQLADTPGRGEPGTGEVAYSRVLREAYELGYRGYVGLECHPSEERVAAERVAAADQW